MNHSFDIQHTPVRRRAFSFGCRTPCMTNAWRLARRITDP